MNRVIENLLGKLGFCFNKRRLFENNAMLILIIFFVTSLILLQITCSQTADTNSNWDKPFDKPMYLLHTVGGKYYDSKDAADRGVESFGIIIDERWILIIMGS